MPLHLVVVGAASRVGATSIATNLAAALNFRRINATLWSGDAQSFGNLPPTNQTADVLLFDVGSKPTQNFDRLWDIAGQVLLVVSPESKSILDGYAAIKLLAERRPSLPIQTVVNFARDAREAEQVHRHLAQTCRRFLNFEITSAGFVSHDFNLAHAMQAGRSIAAEMPQSFAARQFEQMASQIPLENPINYLRSVTRKNLKFAESAITTGRY